MTTKHIWTTHRIAGAYYHKDANKSGFAYIKECLQQQIQSGPEAEQLQTAPYLVLVRDPTNRYDKNAISIRDNRYGELIGWIPKEENRQLAMMMDTMKVKLTGILEQKGTSFSASKLYVRLFLEEPGARTTTPSESTCTSMVKEAQTQLCTMFYKHELDI